MRSLLAAALLLPIAACTTGGLGDLSPDAQMAVGCRSYAATLSSLAVLRPQMTPVQDRAVDDARTVLTPLCETAAAGGDIDVEAMMVSLRDHLRTMLTIENEVAR